MVSGLRLFDKFYCCFLVTRNKVLCPELGLLKHYDIDLKTSHINCDPVARKRKCGD